jgi:PAS domain-containing protein
MNDQSDITKRLWPGGFPGTTTTTTTTTTTPSFQQFPNGLQLNQIWMDSLAKGMTQMEGSYNIATSTNPATALTVPSPRPLAHPPRNGVVLPSRILPSVMPEAPTSPNQNQMQPGEETTQIRLDDADEGAVERERKRKNREFAKRSREKRRNEQKLLEDEVAGLQKINSRLRQIVQEKIPTHAQSILKKCCADHPLHHAANASGNRKEDMLANSDFHLVENLIKQQQSFCLTDPAQPDNPIVYASENFYNLTGFTKEASLGRNCRFLQGKDTGMKSVALIRDSIKNGKDISVNLLNYKADATPFWNQFFIAALRNRTGKIVNYVSINWYPCFTCMHPNHLPLVL